MTIKILVEMTAIDTVPFCEIIHHIENDCGYNAKVLMIQTTCDAPRFNVITQLSKDVERKIVGYRIFDTHTRQTGQLYYNDGPATKMCERLNKDNDANVSDGGTKWTGF